MIFRFLNFDMSRGQGVHNNNNNNNNGHFPEGAENQEIQQWRQSAPGQGVQETQTWMLWEKTASTKLMWTSRFWSEGAQLRANLDKSTIGETKW